MKKNHAAKRRTGKVTKTQSSHFDVLTRIASQRIDEHGPAHLQKYGTFERHVYLTFDCSNAPGSRVFVQLTSEDGMTLEEAEQRRTEILKEAAKVGSTFATGVFLDFREFIDVLRDAPEIASAPGFLDNIRAWLATPFPPDQMRIALMSSKGFQVGALSIPEQSTATHLQN